MINICTEPGSPLQGGEQTADKSSGLVGMTCRNGTVHVTQVIETVGAGEGNRTLVISVEGLRNPSPRQRFSDKSAPFMALCHKGNLGLSERLNRRGEPDHARDRSLPERTKIRQNRRAASPAPGLSPQQGHLRIQPARASVVTFFA